MKKSIKLETLKQFSEKINTDNHVKTARNAGFRNNLLEVAMDWDQYRTIDHSFSIVVKGETLEES